LWEWVGLGARTLGLTQLRLYARQPVCHLRLDGLELGQRHAALDSSCAMRMGCLLNAGQGGA
jgi:hypothetical protein